GPARTLRRRSRHDEDCARTISPRARRRRWPLCLSPDSAFKIASSCNGIKRCRIAEKLKTYEARCKRIIYQKLLSAAGNVKRCRPTCLRLLGLQDAAGDASPCRAFGLRHIIVRFFK